MTWSMEEFFAVFGDDDKEFVGHAQTPPGYSRRRSTDRIRSANSAATTTATCGRWRPPKNEKDKEGKPLQGKSYLVVTVPTYIRGISRR